MPLWACNHCHHEWEGSSTDDQCDWCDGSARILEDETPLEWTIKNLDTILSGVLGSEEEKEK
jgi:hypothetical protein